MFPRGIRGEGGGHTHSGGGRVDERHGGTRVLRNFILVLNDYASSNEGGGTVGVCVYRWGFGQC